MKAKGDMLMDISVHAVVAKTAAHYCGVYGKAVIRSLAAP